MTGMTGGHAGPWDRLVPLLLVPLLLGAGTAYLALAVRAGRRAPWPVARTASFGVGLALLAVALLPPLGGAGHHPGFAAHMAQHLLIGMYAPLALVLGAPVTLTLRALPAPRARRLTAVLGSAPCRLLARPAPAFLLATASLVPLYCTPLYDWCAAHPWTHLPLHLHFLLAGCLWAHVVAGPDPSPARPPVRTRLVWLGAAIAVHALLSQALYGGWGTVVHAPVDDVRAGAQLMYYGGDIAELLLAAALVSTWRPVRAVRARPAP
ncbi:cytochrome c oxidase assembly protein [Streptomyces sp. SID11385]|uniref:cytochrome c oxidase assembly protein n=1 Tax=Streptomyces sp. SID11385 TaxID=2706031 RepID=UPI001EF2ED09|nr:cytochrome c oxidase assembly protein [Streptomyces sp. SID11385]